MTQESQNIASEYRGYAAAFQDQSVVEAYRHRPPYVESYHSRVGFSRERMGAAQAEAFDREVKEALLKSHKDGMITFQVCAHVVWGLPKKKE